MSKWIYTQHTHIYTHAFIYMGDFIWMTMLVKHIVLYVDFKRLTKNLNYFVKLHITD